MALDEAFACLQSNTFKIWLGKALTLAPILSYFDHSHSHEDQERRSSNSCAGAEKQVQEEASVNCFQMGTENPVRCPNVDNFSARTIHLFHCVEI